MAGIRLPVSEQASDGRQACKIERWSKVPRAKPLHYYVAPERVVAIRREPATYFDITP
jgi:hypothetical protein